MLLLLFARCYPTYLHIYTCMYIYIFIYIYIYIYIHIDIYVHTPLRYMYIYLYIYVYIIVIMGHSIYTHQLVIMEHPMSSYRTRYGTFHYVICLPESYRRTHCVCTRQLHHAMLVPGALVLSR